MKRRDVNGYAAGWRPEDAVLIGGKKELNGGRLRHGKGLKGALNEE